ncbi:hypothetical protein HY991_02435 [Candidatus Micrarchaeota archaeon]|nr:hypothetical protein [Candidatus Micrarchaeota archaeon]
MNAKMVPMKQYLTVVGHVAFDVNETPVGKKRVLGGAGYYSALGASLFTKRVRLIARVGRNYDLNRLRKLGINLEGITAHKLLATAEFRQKYDEDFQMKYFHARLKASGKLRPTDLKEEYIDAKFIHLPTAPPKQQAELAERAKRLNPEAVVSIDVFEPYIRKWPGLVKRAIASAQIIFMNSREYELLREYTELKGKTLVIKQGKKGARLITPRSDLMVSAPAVKCVDPTGAGDVLAGAFLALRAGGKSYKDALTKAVEIASHSVTDFGVQHILDGKTEHVRRS